MDVAASARLVDGRTAVLVAGKEPRRGRNIRVLRQSVKNKRAANDEMLSPFNASYFAIFCKIAAAQGGDIAADLATPD